MLETDVKQICALLKRKSITITATNSWLISCVEYFKSQSSSYSISSLLEFVYEQWLLADLKDISAGCLPANCHSASDQVLNDKYAVQINYVVNVAESFYTQLQSIRRPDARGNLEVGGEVADNGPAKKTKAKRELKLEITDGVTTLLAFEDLPIAKLVEPVTPGIKVVLVGPLECRRGVLLLKACNVEILGGEVDTLIVPNAVENILARALGAEENPDPYRNTAPSNLLNDEDDETLMMIADEIDSVVPRSIAAPPQNRNPQCRPQTDVRSLNSSNSFEMDYDFDDDEFELIAAQTASLAERTVANSQKPRNTKQTPKNQSTLLNFLSPSNKNNSDSVHRPNNVTSNSSMQIKNDDAQTNILRKQMEASYNSFDGRNTISLPSDNESTSTANKNIPVNSNHLFDVSYSSAHSEASTIESSWRPCPRQRVNLDLPTSSKDEGKIVVDYLQDEQPPIVNDILQRRTQTVTPSVKKEPEVKQSKSSLEESFPPRNYPCDTTVFASVIKLPQKLSVRKDKWSLSAILQTKGIELEVDFSPDALDKIFGLTAAEVKAKKEEVRVNLAVKERMNEALKASQQRIRNLKSKMTIRFTSYIAKPVVLDVIED